MYIDDIILTDDEYEELVRLKWKLVEEFEIKDLGILKKKFGMEFARSKEGIFMIQTSLGDDQSNDGTYNN